MPPTAIFLAAWFALLTAAVALGSTLVPVVNHTVLFIVSLSPYLMIGSAALALLLLLSQRSWWSIAVAVLLTGTATVTLLPRFVGSSRAEAESIPVRMLTANLWEGAADPTALVAAARAQADVVVLQELTPRLADGLASLESDFPYRAVDAQAGAAGAGIWSRYPIVDSGHDSGYVLGMLNATLRVPGAASDTLVLSAHVVGPWPWPIGDWRREMAKLPQTLRAAARTAGPGAVIVAGDFNATADMQPFRKLLRDGYRAASEQSGAGLTPTYPANRSVPPIAGIDHILTYNSTASDARTVRIPGSDHLGMAATIHIPG